MPWPIWMLAFRHRKTPSAAREQGRYRAAQAPIREAEASIALGKTHIAQNTINAPMSGVVYDLPARAGTYLHPGDLLGLSAKRPGPRPRLCGRAGARARCYWSAGPDYMGRDAGPGMDRHREKRRHRSSRWAPAR